MSNDLYSVLGIDKSATKSDIKKAYRTQAKQHHPDKGGDEAEFKKVQEAYETLSDDQKRSAYDRFGTTSKQAGGGGFGGGGGGFGGFSGDMDDIGDIFSSFFGGFGGGSGRSGRAQKKRGSDLEVTLEITFDQSVTGFVYTLKYDPLVACGTCSGAGGQGKKTCATCSGRGSTVRQMQTPLGVMQQQVTCNACKGEGQTFASPCGTCSSSGVVRQRKSIDVTIPPGIEHGATMRLRDMGNAGERAAGAGDLYVHLRVTPSKKFVREGLHLRTKMSLPLADVLLGGTFPVETFWGKVDLDLPELTREGQVFRLRGKGIASDGRAGDHLVEIHYDMPKRLGRKARKALEALR